MRMINIDVLMPDEYAAELAQIKADDAGNRLHDELIEREIQAENYEAALWSA